MTRDAAVIGLGQMGRGIARNLDREGRLAAAWDTNPEAMARAGLSPAVALAEPATFGGLKAVLFVVPGSAEIRAVLGDRGLLRAPHDGQVLIDLTTSDPAATRAIAAEARATGRDYLDCGMTGGARAADAGTITLMVGGDGAVLEACRPLFRHIADQVFHVGDTGAGHAMKLIHNMICIPSSWPPPRAAGWPSGSASRSKPPLPSSTPATRAASSASSGSPTISYRAPSMAARAPPTSPRIWRWRPIWPARPGNRAPTARSPRACWRGPSSRAWASRTSRGFTSISTGSWRLAPGRRSRPPGRSTNHCYRPTVAPGDLHGVGSTEFAVGRSILSGTLRLV